MKQTLKMALMKKYRNITDEVKKYPCLCKKVDSDYINETVQKRLWTAIGEKLEVEGKAAKVDLKKLLLQKVRRNLYKFLCLLFAHVKLRAFKTNLTPLETPHKDRFVELSFSNTVNDKFDQMYPEYALTEGTHLRESANNMNVEPTTQPQTKTPITFKSKPKNFNYFKEWKNDVND